MKIWGSCKKEGVGVSRPKTHINSFVQECTVVIIQSSECMPVCV